MIKKGRPIVLFSQRQPFNNFINRNTISDLVNRFKAVPRALFDFDEKDQKYTYINSEIECRLPFALMIRLKGYLRESCFKEDTKKIILKWYLELDLIEQKKVVIKYTGIEDNKRVVLKSSIVVSPHFPLMI